MPVTSELLLEQISQQEEAIKAAAESGHDTKSMQEDLKYLRAKFAQSNQALNEGTKNVIKG